MLVNFTGPLDMSMDEVDAAASLVSAAVHPDANIIFGTTFDESMEDEIRITVIATGFEDELSRRAVQQALHRPGGEEGGNARRSQPVRSPVHFRCGFCRR